MDPDNRLEGIVRTFTDKRKELAQGKWSDLAAMESMTNLSDGFIATLAQGIPGISVLAVGGYGRCELGPYSDLDVLVLHDKKQAPDEVTRSLWYPIWDSKVSLDYSVRNISEAMHAAAEDPRVLIGLLDARVICGNADLAKELSETIVKRFRTRAAQYIGIFLEQAEERRSASGELAFLLEPDLKEARGGLRDLVNLTHLFALELAPQSEGSFLSHCNRFLLGSRNLAQRSAGKSDNRLVLQDQDSIAETMGLSGGDELMSKVSEVGRFVSRSLDEFRGVGGRRGSRRRIVLPYSDVPAGTYRQGGKIYLNEALLDKPDAKLVLEVAALSQETGLLIAPEAMRYFADEVEPWTSDWDASAVEALVALLSGGHNLVGATERLDHYGLLERIIPEWKWVRGLPQRNAYHTFTVDRHLVETAVAAGGLRRQVRRPDLLVIAAFLHDIGKGQGGDHSRIGAEIAERIVLRFGLSEYDARVVVRLVRNHLLLADTATRRDIRDPAVIKMVAEAIGDQLSLDLLLALTKADAQATGHLAWSDWKAELVEQLYRSVSGYLETGEANFFDDFPDSVGLELMAQFNGDLMIKSTGEEVWVVASDQVGLLSKVTGALSLLGLNVIRAEVYSESGVALEHLRVVAPHSREIRWSRFRTELVAALSDDDYLEVKLNEKRRGLRNRRMVAESAQISPRVTVESEVGSRHLMVEVCGPDSFGLIHRLTATLASFGLDILRANLVTIGDDVVDTFYALGSFERELYLPSDLRVLEEGLISALVDPS